MTLNPPPPPPKKKDTWLTTVNRGINNIHLYFGRGNLLFLPVLPCQVPFELSLDFGCRRVFFLLLFSRLVALWHVWHSMRIPVTRCQEQIEGTPHTFNAYNEYATASKSKSADVRSVPLNCAWIFTAAFSSDMAYSVPQLRQNSSSGDDLGLEHNEQMAPTADPRRCTGFSRQACEG